MNIGSKIKELIPLVENLKNRKKEERILILKEFLQSFPIPEEISSLSLLALEQEHILEKISPKERELILSHLEKVELFYESIGGLVGYYLRALQLLVSEKLPSETATYQRPPGYDIQESTSLVKKITLQGLKALPKVGAVFLLGGLGDRLNWRGEKGEALPAASLPFLGKSLLELLVRDLQGLEYLYYKIYKKIVLTPLGLMTSFERENDPQIKRLLKQKNWFGRPENLYFLFSQISVPLITIEGDLAQKESLQLHLAPGGHGAFWKTAQAEFFPWLKKYRCEELLIRQINNPIAGIDYGILSLLGIGASQKKTLGIASCERVVNAAEGVIVEVEKEKIRSIANIEYTDFARYGIEDRSDERGFSQFPANTNLIYANIEKILRVIEKTPLPSTILNMKTQIVHVSKEGKKHSLAGGRLECMIQNITDYLLPSQNDPEPVFITFNQREKTMSTAKRSYDAKKSLLETPEGAFFDLLKANHALLAQKCDLVLPPFSTVDAYLQGDISLIFLYHPALGPLYEIIAQKIRGGKIGEKSELQLEIAELYLENLQLQGSLLIEAKNPLGDVSHGVIQYSENSGKCFLKDVQIFNRGRKKGACSSFWKGEIAREERCLIQILGNGELIAQNIVLNGNQTIIVPPNMRKIMTAEASYDEPIDTPSSWKCLLQEEDIRLKIPQRVSQAFISQDAALLNR